MAVDTVTIYNQALSALGTRARVSLPDEVSRENEVCSLWFEHVRQSVLSAARWHSATKSVRLAVKNERDFTVAWTETDPAPGWRFTYTAPPDMLRPQFTSTYARFEPGTYNDDTRVIYTNEEDVILTYTFDNTAISLWDTPLRQAIIHALTAHIAIPLTGKKQLAANALERSNNLIVAARVASANDSYQPLDKLPDWLAARGSAYGTPVTRYYYHDAELLSITGIE